MLWEPNENKAKRNISIVYNAIVYFTGIYEFSISKDLSVTRPIIYFKGGI